MKKITKILLLLLWILIISWTTYSTWQAWGWVNWIAKDEVEQKANRFTDLSLNTADYWIWYYLDTYTWLKWAAQDSAANLRWALNRGYTEPTWNWTNYIYPTGNSESDYPAFVYCDDLWWWNNWRLPSRKELSSIITDAIPFWMTYYTALPSILQDEYWSSTSSNINSDRTWRGRFHEGYMLDNNKDDSKYALCIHD